MDSVRSDHEAIIARASVAKLDRERPVVLAEFAQVDSHSDRHLARPVDQNGLEIHAMERKARSDAVPHLREIDLGE